MKIIITHINRKKDVVTFAATTTKGKTPGETRYAIDMPISEVHLPAGAKVGDEYVLTPAPKPVAPETVAKIATDGKKRKTTSN